MIWCPFVTKPWGSPMQNYVYCHQNLGWRKISVTPKFGRVHPGSHELIVAKRIDYWHDVNSADLLWSIPMYSHNQHLMISITLFHRGVGLRVFDVISCQLLCWPALLSLHGLLLCLFRSFACSASWREKGRWKEDYQQMEEPQVWGKWRHSLQGMSIYLWLPRCQCQIWWPSPVRWPWASPGLTSWCPPPIPLRRFQVRLDGREVCLWLWRDWGPLCLRGSYRWFSARLQELHCISNGAAAVLR